MDTVVVEVTAKLVDTRSGILLWEGHGAAQPGSNGSGNIFADLIAVAGDPLTDIDALRNVQFVMKNGMVFKKDGVMSPEKFFHPGPVRIPNGRPLAPSRDRGEPSWHRLSRGGLCPAHE